MNNNEFMSAVKLRYIGTGLISVLQAFPVLSQKDSAPDKPNILFILVDDMGYSDLGCYGSKFYETPNIDRLAKQGIRFTSSYAACPVSSPTRASIMTGRYPVRTGITDWIPGRQASNSGSKDDRLIALPFRQQLELNEVTIAEVLKQNGYATMISGKWHLGGDREYWPENQGFDVNKGGYSAGQPNKSTTSNGYFSPYGNPRLEDGPTGEYLTDRQTDEAISFIQNSKDKPFFVYLSYYAVHNPMQGKEDLVGKFIHKSDSMGLSQINAFTRDKAWIKPSMSDNFRERIVQSNPVYAAMIYSVDENIGRVLACLKGMGIEKNTIIIFTSDNGGLATSEGSPTCNAPLRAGKGWLYEGGIRVPLIIKWPGISDKRHESSVPVCSVDFLPTITEMTNSVLPETVIDGISIVPIMKGKEIEERPLFWHYPHYSNQGVEPGSAVRLGKYKLIDNFERDRQELYDLENDVSETNDLSASKPEKTNYLFNLLKEWRIKNGAKMMVLNPAWNDSK
jgi:arylsulfatase A-like enzyme